MQLKDMKDIEVIDVIVMHMSSLTSAKLTLHQKLPINYLVNMDTLLFL